MKIDKLLAFNLKQNREKMGFSQDNLAKKAGISKSFLAAIEVCNKFPTPNTLEKLAKALGVDTPELFAMPPTIERTAMLLNQEILTTLEKKIVEKVNPALKAAISEVIADHRKVIDEFEKANMPKKKKTG